MYGVIGVEILTSYLETKMPYQELQDGGQGTYLLVSTTSGLSDPELFLTLTAGDGLDANVIDAGVEKITCRQTDGERWLTLNDETGYAAVQSLDLYSRNAPFSNEKWLLVGTVRSSILFRFARTVQQVITADDFSDAMELTDDMTAAAAAQASVRTSSPQFSRIVLPICAPHALSRPSCEIFEFISI